MAEEFNSKLSREDISRLEKTLSEAKSLTARQEEILKRVLEGERQIGLERIALLDEYFDDYFKQLSKVSKKMSQLSDMYSIIDRLSAKPINGPNGKQKKSSNASKPKTSSGNAATSVKATQKKQQEKQTAENKSNSTKTKQSPETNKNAKQDKDSTAAQQGLSDAELTALGEKTAEEGRLAIGKFTDALTKGLRKTLVSQAELSEEIKKREKQHYNGLIETAESLEKAELSLAARRQNSVEEQIRALETLQLKQIGAMQAAENAALDATESFKANRAYLEESESAEILSSTANAKAEAEAVRELEKQMLADRTAMEDKYLARYGKISEAQQKKINDVISKRYANEEKEIKKIEKDQAKARQEDKKRKQRAETNRLFTKPLSEEDNAYKRVKGLAKHTSDKVTGPREGIAGAAAMTIAGLDTLVAGLGDVLQKLENKIDSIASFKGVVDTRLQGSNNKVSKGSYWDQLVKDMTSVGAVTPFFKQEDFANNIKALVERGIAFDLKQRAFLMTIQNKIANTFDVADGTLLRLIRIQQEDSTAGRLGMESALNTFLNSMYENTEYLQQVADSVRGSLAEMQSLMTGAEAAEVELQVQKWLGSLYSVGMSDTAVNAISNALGQIAAGQIEGLTGDGASNLLIMAANEAGIPISDILTRGITSEETNNLMQAAVNYLAELSESAKDNRVVQQQLANVFGVKASDLRAATNLVLPGSISDISGYNLTYGNMLAQLSAMAGSMHKRTSIAEMMTNLWENGSYTLAGSMASNPVSYFIYKMATVLDKGVGGIPIPGINIMGNMVDLETTVADLMRVAALGSGIMGSIGPVISGLGNSFSGQKMLKQLGIKTGSGLAVTPRGKGIQALAGGGETTTSESGYAGNSSGSDIKNSTMQEANDSKKQQMIEAKEEEEANKVDILNNTVIKIYELLDDVAHGSGSIKVKIDGYGLTSAGKGSSGAQGGVSGLENLSSGASGGSISGVDSDSTGSSFGNSISGGTTLSFSGWTVTA